jgi:hypothetical protein
VRVYQKPFLLLGGSLFGLKKNKTPFILSTTFSITLVAFFVAFLSLLKASLKNPLPCLPLSISPLPIPLIVLYLI